MSEISIAKVKDIPELIDIVVKNDKDIRIDAEEEIIELFHSKLGNFFVYEEQEKIVGFIGYKTRKWGAEDVFWAIWLYIDPEYKRQGIATKLYFYLEEFVRDKGCRKLYLDTGNVGEYKEAILFHEKNGFRLEAELKDFWAKGEDCILFSKTLI